MSDEPELFRRMRAQGRSSISPEELKAYGIERLMKEQEARGPLLLPDLQFTEEENRLLDQILAEEREANDRASQIIEQTPSEASANPMNTLTAAALLALTAASFSAHAQDAGKRNFAGEEYARQQVHAVAKGLQGVPLPQPLLPTKAVAIATVEPLLFSIYGQDNITRQRPYEAYLIDGFWYISGTLPERYTRGGVFEIMVDASNGRVVYLTHGR